MGELSQLPQLAEAEGPPLDGSAQCLREMFAKAARQYSSNFAVRSLYQRGALGIEVNPGHESLDLTYEQLDKESDRVAAYFFGLGISKGQRCAAFLHNSVEWALLFWACVKLGVVFVSLDSSSIKRAALRRHFLQVTTPAVLVVADESAAEILEQHEPVIMQTVIAKTATELSKKLPNGWRSLRVDMLDPDQIGSAVKLIRDIHINHGDMVYMLFTSGTSGLPKACQYTNINVWATCISGKLFRSITSRDALAQHLPPSHLFACFDFILHWTAGATLVYPSKAFDAGSTLDAIHQMQCTQMSGKLDLRTCIPSSNVFYHFRCPKYASCTPESSLVHARKDSISSSDSVGRHNNSSTGTGYLYRSIQIRCFEGSRNLWHE